MKFNRTDRKYRKLNDFIRGEMRRKKISQEDLAYRLNMSQPCISQKLNEVTEWSMREVIDVFEILGVDDVWNW